MSIYSDKIQFHGRILVKEILLEVAERGFQGEQHFCVCFNTNCIGVSISQETREEYTKDDPNMVVMIERSKFENLAVNDNGFAVDLTFGENKPRVERIFVPFTALVSFIDPSQYFHLTFTPKHQMESISYTTSSSSGPNQSTNILIFPGQKAHKPD